WSIGQVLQHSMVQLFDINKLDNEEQRNGLRAVYELERDGFIIQDPSQSDQFKILSDKGLQVVDQDLASMTLPTINIDELLTRSDLRDKVRADYMNGDYDSAVLKAFKLLE